MPADGVHHERVQLVLQLPALRLYEPRLGEVLNPLPIGGSSESDSLMPVGKGYFPKAFIKNVM